MSASTTLRRFALAAVPCLGLVTQAPIASADPSLLIGRGSHIVDVNFGYGRWMDPHAPSGSFGFGVGFLTFTSDFAAVGVDVTADRLGQRTPEPGKEAEDLELVSVLAQGMVHPPAKNLTPYIGVGTGPYFFRSSAQNTDQAKTNWGIMGRTGFRMVGWRPIVGLDYRYHWIMLDPGDATSPAPGKSVTHAMSVKLTLSFLF
ncbi:MAG TPA: hypothetical protein VKF80_06395 [Candidatus Eisenbacteria bacterium]|nr:hypothetical protein [Candidatus Eisenbacteria bacterium]